MLRFYHSCHYIYVLGIRKLWPGTHRHLL
uniref:Uncharacterized protein n=1 Tax=Anguilla anguilla TaxID=7936 RepID=A0A0E9PI14_ANGAN